MPYDTTHTTTTFYIHWPFCPDKCNSCPSSDHDQDLMDRYQLALVKEIEQFASAYQGGGKLVVKTLYIGGGVPSYPVLEGGLDIPGILSKLFDFKSSLEVSVEVSPETILYAPLASWKACGINRISFGVHSVKDTVLQSYMSLDKGSTEKLSSLFNAMAEYFNNISVDLLLGMPDISFDAWKKALHYLVTQPITHISLYFADAHDVPSSAVLDDEAMITCYEWTSDFLHAHGFERYELSNFCKPGFASSHHEVYWDHIPYKGFGLGAASFDGVSRFQNETDIMSYCEKIEQGKDVTAFTETLTLEQIHLERLMLGLRRKKGLALQEVIAGFSDKKGRGAAIDSIID